MDNLKELKELKNSKNINLLLENKIKIKVLKKYQK